MPLVRRRRVLPSLVLVLALAGTATPAAAHDHDPKRSGHPLRVLAYVLHPVGWLLDRAIFRPAHWLVHHEPLDEIFGHDGGY